MQADAPLVSPEDLRVESWPPRPSPGGQHVTLTVTGVCITHIPSGIVACVEIGRSQHINRLIAMEMILEAITHPEAR